MLLARKIKVEGDYTLFQPVHSSWSMPVKGLLNPKQQRKPADK